MSWGEVRWGAVSSEVRVLSWGERLPQVERPRASCSIVGFLCCV